MTDPLSRAFSALADPTRRDMVARLTEGDQTLSELAGAYDVSLQAVSKHLKVLESAGLVTRTREAQRRPVHLEHEVLATMTTWIERHHHRAEQRMARLEEVLGDMTSTSTDSTSRPSASSTRQAVPFATNAAVPGARLERSPPIVASPLPERT